MKRSSGIGGQAVLEGIMMRNKEKYAVAVRKPDQEIEVKVDEYKGITSGKKLINKPFIRGVFNFIDSLVLGIKTLMYSAEFYEDEEEVKKEGSEKSDEFWMTVTMIISVIFSVGLFFVLPYLISEFFMNVLDIQSNAVLSIVDGVVKVAIFISYIALISLMKDIKRTYMYHGAEHKCINCIEDGKILNVENVKTSSRFHRRCGTSFLFLVMFISIALIIIVSSFLPEDASIWMNILVRLVLIPVVAGVSYEVLRIAGCSDSKLIRVISAPGMALQKITTKEPDDSMIEVAIKAVEAVFDWEAYLEEIKQEELGQNGAGQNRTGEAVSEG